MYESLSIPPEWMHCPLPGDEAWLDAEALTLSGDEISRFDDTRVLETLASLHAVRARADALETHALARLHELRAGARGTAEEAAFELRTTRHTAETRIRRAEHLLRCHPNLLAAMEDGVVEGYAAGRVAALTAPLPDELAREVDRRLAPKLTGGRAVLDPTALRRAARKTILHVDPDGETARATVARADRKVELLPGEHSMSTLLADLPAEVAASAYTSIDTAARALRHNGETRTLDQLRADILADRLIGGGNTGTPGGAMVHLHMPIDAALTITDTGCELDGYGPIPAPIARQIMTDPNSVWRKVICDPAAGAVMDLGRSKYRPNAAIRDVVNVRDRECGTPGCYRPAKHSDFDHIQSRQNHGVTSTGNGNPKCEHHNNLKEHPGWTLGFDPETGQAAITTPAKRTYTEKCEPILKPRTSPEPTQQNTDPADDPPSD